MRRITPNENTALTATCPFCGRLGGEVFSQTDCLGRLSHTCSHFKGINNAGKLRFVSDSEMEKYFALGKSVTFNSDDSIIVDGKPVSEYLE